jgi:hypothetical protein
LRVFSRFERAAEETMKACVPRKRPGRQRRERATRELRRRTRTRRALFHTAAADSPLAFQVFASEPEVLAVKPYVVAFQHILRCAPRRAPPPSPPR